jgi:hypothetical protein
VRYSDIDFWALDGSEASKMRFFDKDFPSFLKEENAANNKPGYNNHFKYGSSSFSFTKGSFWANTFQFYGKNVPFQFIKSSQASIEELLNSFDLGISSCALYKGEFYLHDSFLESLSNQEICYNNKHNFTNKPFATRLYQTIRFMKYYNKTNFSFSKELSKDIIKTLIDADEYKNAMEQFKASKSNILKPATSYPATLLPDSFDVLTDAFDISKHVKKEESDESFIVINFSGKYPQKVSTRKSILGMCDSLSDTLMIMSKMKNFDKSDIFFFDQKGLQNPQGVLKSLVNEV